MSSYLDRFRLRDKVVLLSGAAGLYGRGLPNRLAQAGVKLVLAPRNLEALQVIAKEEKESGPEVFAESLELAWEVSITGLVKRILDRFGRLCCVVNNASLRSMSRASKAPFNQWATFLAANAAALLPITRSCGRKVYPGAGGSPVHVRSIMRGIAWTSEAPVILRGESAGKWRKTHPSHQSVT